MIAIPLLLALVVFLGVVTFGISWLNVAQRRKRIIEENQCQPPPCFPHKDPIFGLDYLLANYKANNALTLLDKTAQDFETYGSTFRINQLGSEVLITRDWRIVKACMSTSWTDWGVSDMRYPALHPLLGRNFFILDGPEWKRKRAQTRPALSKAEFADLSRLEKHIQSLFRLIPNDGSSINMAGPFTRLLQNISTEYFLGETVDMLSSDVKEEHQRIMDDFEVTMKEVMKRVMMGSLLRYLPIEKNFLKATQELKAFVEKNISRAMERRQNGNKSVHIEKSHRVFVDDMLEQTANRADIRDAALGLYMAGADTTRSAIISAVWTLARYPHVVEKMRKEILATCTNPPKFEEIQKLLFVRATVFEVMRLYGPINTFNFRTAIKDTILPYGGAMDGHAPLFVKKGTTLMMDYRALHRNPITWGANATNFCPERFLEHNDRDFFMFQPFGGGPRQCPGQNLAITNLCYIVTRLLQEFKEIHARDNRPYTPETTLVTTNKYGAEVAFVPA